MPLLKLPDEVLLEIGLHLHPEPPQLTEKPFHAWAATVREYSLTYPAQARTYFALGQACKRLYGVLPRENLHAHAPGLNIEKIRSILKNPQIQSLSSGNILDVWTRQLGTWLLPPMENRSVHTLCLSDFAINEVTLGWLVSQLKGLKTLYLECMFDPSLDEVETRETSSCSIISVLTDCAKSLEKLVLTRQGTGSQIFNFDLTSLASFHNLASLSINSYTLLGNDDFDDTRDVFELLPSSLRELEVIWDDGTRIPFMGFPFSGAGGRPDWLFWLLKGKLKKLPKLERVRIISSEEWYPGLEESEVWDGSYTSSPHDWTEEEENESWRPPTELIVAAETAQVSIGIWLHTQRQFKLVLPGCEWFADSWEDTWSDPNVVDYEEEESMQEDDADSDVYESSEEEEGYNPDSDEIDGSEDEDEEEDADDHDLDLADDIRAELGL